MAVDTLTHALSGALLARVLAPRLPQAAAPTLRRALLAGALMAAFPDSDVVIRFFSDQLTYLNLHRGVTHSLIVLPLWALLLASCFSLLERSRRNWLGYFLLATASIAIHIAGDVITTYGTQILAPFSPWKASIPLTFIIDPWFTGIIVAGLIVSWWRRATTLPATFALIVLAGYVGLQGIANGRAVALGEKHARQQGYQKAQVAALPQPLSPFNWKIIVSTDEHYDIAYINLHRDEMSARPSSEESFFARIDALYQPVDTPVWRRHTRFGEAEEQQMLSREVWDAPVMARVRRFIEYPALARISQSETAGTCIWFDDLRFTLSDVRSPFRFGACRSERQVEWQLFRLRDDNLIPL